MNLKQLAFLPDDIDWRLGPKVDPAAKKAEPEITPAPPFMVEGYEYARGGAPQHSVENLVRSLGGRPDIIYHMDAGMVSLYINLLIIARRGTP